MGLLDASAGAGGSVNSAQSAGTGQSYSLSDSWSRTYGSEATAKSYAEALRAHARQQDFYNQAMNYNANEAEKQRYFNMLMGNSIYTRSVENMKAAGINPILAASMGLSGASVNSGAAASVSTPSTFMGQTFADQASASHSESGSSWNNNSSSSGSSWQNSESGLATALTSLGGLIDGIIGKINAGNTINIALDGLQQTMENVASESNPGAKELDNSDYQEWANDLDDGSTWGKIKKSIATGLNGIIHSTGGWYNPMH